MALSAHRCRRAVVGALAFGQAIRPAGWLGIALVVAGVAALKLA